MTWLDIINIKLKSCQPLASRIDKCTSQPHGHSEVNKVLGLWLIRDYLSHGPCDQRKIMGSNPSLHSVKFQKFH